MPKDIVKTILRKKLAWGIVIGSGIGAGGIGAGGIGAGGIGTALSKLFGSH